MCEPQCGGRLSPNFAKSENSLVNRVVISYLPCPKLSRGICGTNKTPATNSSPTVTRTVLHERPCTGSKRDDPPYSSLVKLRLRTSVLLCTGINGGRKTLSAMDRRVNSTVEVLQRAAYIYRLAGKFNRSGILARWYSNTPISLRP